MIGASSAFVQSGGKQFIESRRHARVGNGENIFEYRSWTVTALGDDVAGVRAAALARNMDDLPWMSGRTFFLNGPLAGQIRDGSLSYIGYISQPFAISRSYLDWGFATPDIGGRAVTAFRMQVRTYAYGWFFDYNAHPNQATWLGPYYGAYPAPDEIPLPDGIRGGPYTANHTILYFDYSPNVFNDFIFPVGGFPLT